MEAMRYQVKLNLEDTGIVKSSIRVKQGDSAITFVFKVFKNGLDVYSASNIPSVVFKRPDGSSVVGTASVAEGQYTYTLSGNELQYAGSMIADVKFSLDSDRESTCSFAFECVPDTMSPDTNPAGTFVNSLKDIIDAVNEGVEKVEQAAATLDMQEIIDIKNEIQALVDRLPDFTIDSEMSDTSEHALQNKVITNAINRIDEILESVELTGKASSISITTNNKLAEVNKLGGLSNKVTVDGTTSLESNPIVEVKSENNVFDGKWSQANVDGGGNLISNANYIAGTTAIPCSAGQTFKFKVNATVTRIRIGYYIGTIGTYSQFTSNEAEWTVPNGVTQFRFDIGSGWVVANAPQMQISNMTDSYTIPTESRQKLIDMGYGMGINSDTYNGIYYNQTYHNMLSIDLGDLDWVVHSTNIFRCDNFNTLKEPTDNLLCDRYSVTPHLTASSNMTDKSMKSNDTNSVQRLFIKDTSYTDATTFKNAMKGVILHYEAKDNSGSEYEAIVYKKKCASRSYQSGDESNTNYLTDGSTTTIYPLTTEQIYDVTDLLQSDNIVEVEKGGTLSFIDSSGVAKAVPYEVTLLGTSDATVKLNAILKGNEKEDADNSIVGDAWTSSKTYAVGEYCISADKLWKCKVQHTNVIPSEGTYWTCVSVTDEIGTLNTSFSTKTNNNFGTEVNIPLDTDFTCPSDGLVQYGGYSTSVTQIYINGALYSSIYGGAQAGASIWNNARVNKNDVVKIIDYNSSNASNVHRFYPTT